MMEQKKQAISQIHEQMSKKEIIFIAQQAELDVILNDVQSIRIFNEMLNKQSGKDILSTEVKK